MQERSSWDVVKREEYPALRGAYKVDVAIVGGGLAGLSLAAMASGQGLSVAVIEAHRLAEGATRACTGKVTAQLQDAYGQIIRTMGAETAGVYARLMHESMHGAASLCEDMGVKHMWQDVNVYAQNTEEERLLADVFQQEKAIGLPVGLTSDTGDCPVPAAQMIRMQQQLILPPVPYALALASVASKRGCRIWEHSPVERMEGTRLYTPGGYVEAQHVVLATGYPMGTKKLLLMGMLEQRRAVARTLTGGTACQMSYLSASPEGMNFRPLADGGLLMSSVLGRVGMRGMSGAFDRLNAMQQALLGDWQQTHEVVCQDVWSGDGLPLIGPIDQKNEQTLIMTGFGGWGVANSFLAARIITGYLTGQPVDGAEICLPFRQYRGKAGVIVQESAKTAGAFTAGLLRFGTPLCPHMGCRLRYDLDAQQWACPCHGSSFSSQGKLIHGPAMEDADVSGCKRPSR